MSSVFKIYVRYILTNIYQEMRKRLDAKYLKKKMFEAAKGYRIYVQQNTGSDFFG